MPTSMNMDGGEEASRECPNCHSKKNWKDGRRATSLGSIQKFRCRCCDFRFSEKSNIESAMNRGRQLCALLRKAKKLDSQTEIKTVCAGIEKLPQDAKGLVTQYSAYLEKGGYPFDTTYPVRVATLARRGANLLDPESVKTAIGQQRTKERNKTSICLCLRHFR